MLFDWSQYKELAEELRQRNDEASKRTAISRLYYSVYWKARILLEREDPNLEVSPDKSHAFVWKKFEKKGTTRNKIWSDGTRLKEYRQKADYESEIAKLEDVVEISFSIANQIIKNLDAIAGNK